MRRGLRHALAVAALAFLLILALLHPSLPWRDAPPPESEPRDPVVTLEEFERIEPGMTYEKCVAIIGAEATPFGASTDAARPAKSIEWISMRWRNPDGSSAELSFNYGELTRKRAYDLE